MKSRCSAQLKTHFVAGATGNTYVAEVTGKLKTKTNKGATGTIKIANKPDFNSLEPSAIVKPLHGATMDEHSTVELIGGAPEDGVSLLNGAQLTNPPAVIDNTLPKGITAIPGDKGQWQGQVNIGIGARITNSTVVIKNCGAFQQVNYY